MKRLIIVAEGQTEEEFVKKSLAPFLQGYGILSVTPICLRTSRNYKGGLLNYQQYKNDVVSYLKQETDIILTSFIDYFRLPTSFPNYSKQEEIADLYDRIKMLEESIQEDINDNRFFAYIQLHEFEALVFSELKGFQGISELYPNKKKKIIEQVSSVMDEYPNPEKINTRPELAPSKRLQSIIPGYNKILYGNLIIEENGLDVIIKKCPHFKEWVERIIFEVTGNIISL